MNSRAVYLLLILCSISGCTALGVQRKSFSLAPWKAAKAVVPAEVVVSLRGGASEVEEVGNPLVTKLRNLVRSLLEIGERKSPLLTKLLKQFVKAAETLLGIKLLPEPKSAVKKKRKKSKSKVAAVDHDKTYVSQNEEEKETTGSKTPTAKAKVSASGGSKSAVNTQKHLVTKISSTNPNYRIQRELKEFIRSPPPNLSVKVGSNIRIWIIQMVGAKNTIYEGEVYKLRVQFPKDYPTVPPSVYFLQPTPQHEHVYTNGDICLSLLGKDWRPTMTAQSIAVSILSILSSAQSKSLPMDNARHSQNKPGQYQKDWIYHDDNC